MHSSAVDFLVNACLRQLFKFLSAVHRLFTKPQLKYMKNEIVIMFPTVGHWLPHALELLSELKKMV